MNSGGQLARFTENVQNFMITPEFLSQASKLVNRPFSLGHNEPVVAAKLIGGLTGPHISMCLAYMYTQQ